MVELGKGEARLVYDLAQDSDGAPLVKLSGELDLTTAPGLDRALDPIIGQDPSRLVIEASELEFADSSGIALLVRLANHVPQVEIRQPPEILRRVIARMGLSDRLQVRP